MVHFCIYLFGFMYVLLFIHFVNKIKYFNMIIEVVVLKDLIQIPFFVLN